MSRHPSLNPLVGFQRIEMFLKGLNALNYFANEVSGRKETG
jgi:hypothetical protein